MDGQEKPHGRLDGMEPNIGIDRSRILRPRRANKVRWEPFPRVLDLLHISLLRHCVVLDSAKRVAHGYQSTVFEELGKVEME
jgi:hypothetical protein